MKALLLVACCAPLACCGLRYAGQERERGGSHLDVTLPETPRPPLGRHIQWSVNAMNCAGIRDRAEIMDWLLDLAAWNNATVHISGGWQGADRYLCLHSRTANREWSHYLSVPAGCGQGPFNEIEPFEGCRDVTDPDFDFSRPLFSGADGCVNVNRKFQYHNAASVPAPRPEDSCHLTHSDQARIHAQRVVADLRLPPRFGVAHVRRCDTGAFICTEPENVAATIHSVPDVLTWLVFYYAERGYKDRLAQALAYPHYPASSRTVIFEDGMNLNPFQDGDNFYAWQVAEAITMMSTVHFEARKCGDRNHARVVSMTRQGGLYSLDADYNTFALCGGVPGTR